MCRSTSAINLHDPLSANEKGINSLIAWLIPTLGLLDLFIIISLLVG